MVIKTNGLELPNGDVHTFIPPSPTETERGGIKAKARTTEPLEVVIDQETGKAYASGNGIEIINTAVSPSPLIINDSADRPIRDLKIFGNSEQATTTGKNLFDINATDSSTMMNQIKVIDGKLVVVDPRPYPRIKITNVEFLKKEILESPTKKLSISCKQGANVNFIRLYVQVLKGEEKTDMTVQPGGKPIDLSAATDILDFTIHVFMDDTTITDHDQNSIYDIQIELSDVSTEYEPYTGGQSSPSPEYPQEIRSVGKYNEETGKYDVDVVVSGKNLYDGNFEIGLLSVSDGIVYKKAPKYAVTDFIKVLPNTKYCYSGGLTGDPRIVEYDENKQYVKGQFSNYAFTTDKTSYIRCMLTFEKENEMVDDVLVMIGEKPTDYEPYREPQTLKLSLDQPLRGIGDYKDEVTEYGIVRKVVTESNNTISSFNTWNVEAKNYRIVFKPKYVPTSDKNNKWICDMFKSIGTSMNNTQMFLYPTIEDLKMMGIDPNATKEEADLKLAEFISQNPFTFEYAILEPTTEPLPEDFKQELEKLSTHYPTTIITVDSKVESDIEMTYVADTKNFILEQIRPVKAQLVNTQAQLL